MKLYPYLIGTLIFAGLFFLLLAIPDRPNSSCEDTCDRTHCEGDTYIYCETSQAGCNEILSSGVIPGRCGVSCSSHDDCSSFAICSNSTCRFPSTPCGDGFCSPDELSICSDDCGKSAQPYLSTFPVLLMTDDSNLRENVFIVVGNRKPRYQLTVANRLVNELVPFDPTIEKRVKTINEISDLNGSILIIIGNECDNEYYRTLGGSCSPFTSKLSYIQVTRGETYHILVYGNAKTIDSAVSTLINATAQGIRRTVYSTT